MKTAKLKKIQMIGNFPEWHRNQAPMIENRSVGGSIPPLGTIISNT
jgi:hypothetical protein